MNIRPSNLIKIDPNATANQVRERTAYNYEVIGEFENTGYATKTGGHEGVCFGACMKFADASLRHNDNQAVDALQINKDEATVVQARHELHQANTVETASALGLEARELVAAGATLKVTFDTLREAYERGTPGIYLVTLYNTKEKSGHAIVYHLADDVNARQCNTVTYFDPNDAILKVSGNVGKQIDSRANVYQKKQYDAGALTRIILPYVRPSTSQMRQSEVSGQIRPQQGVRSPDVQTSQARGGEQGNPAYTNKHL